MIKEIHIIHHSHTDFGYTDLPSTLQEQQVRYITEAIAIARKTEKSPSESKFRWTCEVLLPVADFLAQAQNTTNRSGGMRRRLRQMIASTLPCSRMPNSISSCRCKRLTGVCRRLADEKPKWMDSVLGLKGRGSIIISLSWKR